MSMAAYWPMKAMAYDEAINDESNGYWKVSIMVADDVMMTKCAMMKAVTMWRRTASMKIMNNNQKENVLSNGMKVSNEKRKK